MYAFDEARTVSPLSSMRDLLLIVFNIRGHEDMVFYFQNTRARIQKPYKGKLMLLFRVKHGLKNKIMAGKYTKNVNFIHVH